MATVKEPFLNQFVKADARPVILDGDGRETTAIRIDLSANFKGYLIPVVAWLDRGEAARLRDRLSRLLEENPA